MTPAEETRAMNKQQIGDYTFAEFNYDAVVLTREDGHPGEEVSARIVLEWPEFAALVAFVDRLERKGTTQNCPP